jgi:hypothetical protein
MGLDAYAYATDDTTLPVTDENLSEDTADRFWYGRKIYFLQDWMEHLYHSKGGTSDFNCSPVEVDLADLVNLENDLNGNLVPSTGQPYFLVPDNQDLIDFSYEIECITKFISDARFYITQNHRIFYDSWH